MCLIHIIQGTRGCGGEYKINSRGMMMMMIMIFCIHPREGPMRFPRRERRGCDELVREVEDLRMVLGIKRGREGGRRGRADGGEGGEGGEGRYLEAMSWWTSWRRWRRVAWSSASILLAS